MKNIILIILLVAGKASVSQQTAANAGIRKKASTITEIMAQKLSLNDHQKESVNKINLTFFGRIQTILQSPDSASIKKQQIISVNKERVAAFKDVLTITQFKRYQDDMKELEKKSRDKMEEHKAKQNALAIKQDSVNKSRSHQPRTSN